MLLDLQESLVIDDSTPVQKDILRRETSHAPFAGRGVAYPHGTSAGISELTVALGLSRTGIPCDAPDQLPCNIVLLTLSPEDAPDKHCRILTLFRSLLQNPVIWADLIEAETTSRVLEIIQAWENEQDEIDSAL